MTLYFDGIAGPFPVGTRISQPFGYDPTYPGNAEHFHYGTDFAVVTGTEAAYPTHLGNGLVVIAGPFGGYGTALVVRYEEPGVRWYLLYGHLQQSLVAVGETVHGGEIIALTNNTGFSTGPHCHFAVGRESFYGGAWQDPEPWLKARETTPDPWEVFMATLTDAQKDALIAQATQANVDAAEWAKSFKGFLSPLGFAARDALFDSAHDPGSPMNHVAIGIRRMGELMEALQLNKDEIAALPEPKYTTLKKLLIDLQERAQEP